MESLSENRPLMYSVLFSGGAVFALALGLLPDLSNQFEIVEFPTEVNFAYSMCHVLYYSYVNLFISVPVQGDFSTSAHSRYGICLCGG